MIPGQPQGEDVKLSVYMGLPILIGDPLQTSLLEKHSQIRDVTLSLIEAILGVLASSASLLMHGL